MTAITNFHIIRPKFETPQDKTLEWIAAAHCQSEGNAEMTFSEKFHERLHKVACKPGSINMRGHELPDFQHTNWQEMQIYALNKQPHGAPLSVRQEFHRNVVDDLFERFYESERQPDNILHVTCTGYTSPSGGQKIVSKRGWHTHVTHVYHMGCYAAIPALRIADGFSHKVRATDIVHTELCTIHQHPELHDASQLVVESLFADGFIKYTVTNEPQDAHFQLIETYEELVPNSLELMQWHLSDTGFQFVLAKEIPVAIARHLAGYIERLFQKAKIDLKEIKNVLFAVHPGGPKIFDYVQKWMSLENEQLEDSREILKLYGNMSSATLPHIWQRMLEQRKGNLIVSLAFGPGLTIAGAIFRRVDS